MSSDDSTSPFTITDDRAEYNKLVSQPGFINYALEDALRTIKLHKAQQLKKEEEAQKALDAEIRELAQKNNEMERELRELQAKLQEMGLPKEEPLAEKSANQQKKQEKRSKKNKN